MKQSTPKEDICNHNMTMPVFYLFLKPFHFQSFSILLYNQFYYDIFESLLNVDVAKKCLTGKFPIVGS